ncbi:MAG: VWA domain-containing protein [Acidobacteriota bacterium]
MAERKPVPRICVLVIVILLAQPAALGDDFDMIVKNIESHYNAKKRRIPFLGLAGFFVKIIRPAGVKSFKLAVFDEQDFRPGQRDFEFERSVKKSINSKKWKPMTRAISRSTGNRAFVYTHQSGKDMEMLTVTFSNRQAIVVQAKINPDAVARFMEKPEILGFSLAGSFKGSPSIFDPSSTIFNAGSSGGSQGDSLAALRDPNAPRIEAEAKSKPVLKVRSAEDDSDLNPLAGEERPSAVKSSEDAIRLEARLVNLNVKATNRGGDPISNLNKSDFRVFEEGVEQDIFYFEPVSAPINLVLLLDLSGSTREKRTVMIEAAKKFIDSLAPQDRIAVAGFTRDFVVAVDFTTDRKLLKKAVDRMKKIQGGTAYYDAMWLTLDLLERVKDARQAVVVLTDGVDNSLLESSYEPSDHSFDELLGRVMESDATIYPVYLNPEETRLQQALAYPEVSDSRRERLKRKLQPNLTARQQLEQLAEETAGTMFVAEDESDLEGVYQKVAAELRLIYTLAYAPKNLDRDGKYRRLTVEVNRDGARVKARRGYYAK